MGGYEYGSAHLAISIIIVSRGINRKYSNVLFYNPIGFLPLLYTLEGFPSLHVTHQYFK